MIRITSFHIQWSDPAARSPYMMNPVVPEPVTASLEIFFRTDSQSNRGGQVAIALTIEEDSTLRELLRKVIVANFTADAVLP